MERKIFMKLLKRKERITIKLTKGNVNAKVILGQSSIAKFEWCWVEIFNVHHFCRLYKDAIVGGADTEYLKIEIRIPYEDILAAG